MTRGLLLGLAVAAAACDAPAAPSRLPIYSYADTIDGQPVVFHWPASHLPVRYYAAPQGYLPDLVGRALVRWERTFLYGEFTGALIADSAAADVIVTFETGTPPAAEPRELPPVQACDGRTTPVFATPDTLERPIRVGLRWFAGYAAEDVAACLDRVTTHEIGHTLGFFNAAHAGADSADIMDAFPRVYRPGNRDRAAAEYLYHTGPTVFPPPRR